MFIRQFVVKNYLIHARSTINLSPLTVVVGPNGGGKSALFDAMLNFSMLARGNLRQAFGPYPYSFNATLFHGALNPKRIGFDVEMSKSAGSADRVRYQIDYAQSAGGALAAPLFHIFAERLWLNGECIFDREDPGMSSLKRAVEYIEDDRGILAAIRKAQLAGANDIDDSVAYVAQQISRFNRFRLNPLVLAQPSYLPDASTVEEAAHAAAPIRLGYEGENLAALLFWLKEKEHPALALIAQKVAPVLDGFESFEFDSVGTERIAFSIKFSDRRGTVSAAKLSHGSLMFIGLVALVTSPNRPPLLFIEEPENGLTPKAVGAFYASLRALAQPKSDGEQSQVLISSHSPFVICSAWNGDDRNFIHQIHISDGQAEIVPFGEWVTRTGVHLQKDKEGKRTILSLRLADALMSDYRPEDVPVGDANGTVS